MVNACPDGSLPPVWIDEPPPPPEEGAADAVVSPAGDNGEGGVDAGSSHEEL